MRAALQEKVSGLQVELQRVRSDVVPLKDELQRSRGAEQTLESLLSTASLRNAEQAPANRAFRSISVLDLRDSERVFPLRLPTGARFQAWTATRNSTRSFANNVISSSEICNSATGVTLRPSQSETGVGRKLD